MKKPRHVSLINIFRYNFLSTLFNSYFYLCVSFRAVDIIISNKEKNSIQKSWWWKQHFCFSWRVSHLKDEQKLVWTSLSKNRQKLPHTETGIAQPPKQVHMTPRWDMKFNWPTHFFLLKRSFLMWILVEAFERFDVGLNLHFFFFKKKWFFLAKQF